MSTMTHLVCPHCDAVNRLEQSKLGQQIQCGRCHQALFTGTPLDLNATRFEKQLERSDIPLLVDFWAPWCGPCKIMAPQFAAAAKDLEPRMRLIKINTENEPMLGNRFNIRSIPTMVLFEQGKESKRISGALGKADIIRWVS